ncbi:Hypothetical predicted protein [Xyrichtys novacula]|uniref:Uncharacterized protein n=1 Tax=Xyrichtys novacula TaxID=13765 RepID=A0AAV1FF81_XYRNO|nr:Hypothetical predicted protein [Xyrichtys novacula]
MDGALDGRGPRLRSAADGDERRRAKDDSTITEKDQEHNPQDSFLFLLRNMENMENMENRSRFISPPLNLSPEERPVAPQRCSLLPTFLTSSVERSSSDRPAAAAGPPTTLSAAGHRTHAICEERGEPLQRLQRILDQLKVKHTFYNSNMKTEIKICVTEQMILVCQRSNPLQLRTRHDVTQDAVYLLAISVTSSS